MSFLFYYYIIKDTEKRKVKVGKDRNRQHKLLVHTYIVAGPVRSWEIKKPHRY